MIREPSRQALPPAQLVADRVFNALDRFLHVETLGGLALLVVAAAALLWANSPAAGSYHDFWHATVTIGVGGYQSSQTLHFWINDGLMTIFFLVVGMEVRREIHEGALANARLAALPLAAALGGVVLPALCYLAINADPGLRAGWAVPTATDIAFAIGVLALLGRSVAASVRVLLLALAVIDDIAAVIIIALFYSDGLQYTGFLIAAAGVLLVFGFQRIGIGAAYAYIPPGVIVWFGLLHGGVHPTLAGVMLGLLTPVMSLRAGERPIDVAFKALSALGGRGPSAHHDPRVLMEPLRQLRYAQREILPPVVRVQAALHPWVAFGVMPLFALANAGVNVVAIEPADAASSGVMLGVVLALLIGKPVGIVAASWMVVRLRWCALPPGVTWPGVLLVGCLGGIGFTMSIFIATLAFSDEGLLNAAKSGVLLGSAGAGVLGVTIGRLCLTRDRGRRTQVRPGLALVAALLLLSGASAPPFARAGELAPLSAAELAQRCLTYTADRHGADGRSCAAYIRGFVEGSPLVQIRAPDVAHQSRESFSERAFRTRLGVRGGQRPLYCLDGTVTVPQFVAEMLELIEVQPPAPDASASDLLLSTLERSYRCAG